MKNYDARRYGLGGLHAETTKLAESVINLRKTDHNQYEGRLAADRGRIVICTQPCNEGVEVRTSVYDGKTIYLQPEGQYDPEAAANAEFKRLKNLLREGKSLSS